MRVAEKILIGIIDKGRGWRALPSRDWIDLFCSSHEYGVLGSIIDAFHCNWLSLLHA